MDKICSIISGGEYSEMSQVTQSDFIIACDHGYDYAIRAGITPNILIGDFDSCIHKLPKDMPVKQLPKEKDDTDTISAIRLALELGYRHIRLYCALGGRLDHLYANIQAAAFAVSNKAYLEILSSDCEIYVFGHRTVLFPKRDSWSLSVFSITDACHDVIVKGVKYPLNSVMLTNKYPIGVSNEWRDNAEVGVGEGIVAVMLCEI